MVRLCGGEPAPMLFDPPLPIRTPLVVAAAASQPRPLLPPALNILLLSATSATPSHDVHCSRSPVPSAQAAKKKAAVDSGTGRPVASAALLPPPKVPSAAPPGVRSMPSVAAVGAQCRVLDRDIVMDLFFNLIHGSLKD